VGPFKKEGIIVPLLGWVGQKRLCCSGKMVPGGALRFGFAIPGNLNSFFLGAKFSLLGKRVWGEPFKKGDLKKGPLCFHQKWFRPLKRFVKKGAHKPGGLFFTNFVPLY